MSIDPQTTRDRGEELRSETRASLWRMAGPWWLLLLTGIAWLIISVIVLRFTTTSAATVGVLLGVVFLAAMANEFFIAYVRLGWRWAHMLMGIIFLAAAIWAFVPRRSDLGIRQPGRHLLGSGLGDRAAAGLAGGLRPDHLDRVQDHQQRLVAGCDRLSMVASPADSCWRQDR